MGGGASSHDHEVQLQNENQKLRKRILTLERQLQNGSMSESKVSDDSVVANGGNNGRRNEVTAEVRSAQKILAQYSKVFHPKSTEDEMMLERACSASLLFNDMRSEEKKECVDAFYLETFNAGAPIITQGETGNHFYVLGDGTVEVLVKSARATKPASKGMLDREKSFGELALMYNTPRAATIVARSLVNVWVLERSTFVQIATFFKQKRLQKYSQFLKKVDLFKDMEVAKLSRIAEALEDEYHDAGDCIVLEGEVGNHFYLIEEGEVRYTKKNAMGEDEEVGRSGPGGFFGERALLGNDMRSASVYATSPVRLLCMERMHFQTLMKGLEKALRPEAEKEAETRDAMRVGEQYRKDIGLSDLEILRTLGEGAFGRVRLVKHPTSGQLMALKYLAKQQIIDTNCQAHVLNERKVMLMIDHPNLLRLYNTFQDSRYIYLLLELVRGGELFTVLRDRESVTEKAAKFYGAGVILGFEHLHEKFIVYRDLKPENILLDDNGYVKVCDFGLSKIVEDRTWTVCGTPDYLAPEIIANRGHDKAVDLWAVGVLLFEMVSGSTPFYSEDVMEIYDNVMRVSFKCPSKFSRALKDLISQFLRPNPSKRIGSSSGYEAIRIHKWFVGFDWSAYLSQSLPAPYVPKKTSSGNTKLANFDDYEEIDVNSVPETDWDIEGF